MFEGKQPGRWAWAQRPGGRVAWAGEDKRDLLSAIGVEEDPGLVAAKEAAEAKPKVSRTDRFAQGLAGAGAVRGAGAASSGAPPAQGAPGDRGGRLRL